MEFRHFRSSSKTPIPYHERRGNSGMGHSGSDDQRVGDGDFIPSSIKIQRRWVQTVGHYDLSNEQATFVEEAIRASIRLYVRSGEGEAWAEVFQWPSGEQVVAREEATSESVLSELRQLYRFWVKQYKLQRPNSPRDKRVANKQPAFYRAIADRSSASSPFPRRAGPKTHSYMDERRRHCFRPYDGKRHYGSRRTKYGPKIRRY